MNFEVSNKTRLRREVSSNVTVLAELHEQYGWIPGAESIRPPPEVIAQKVKDMEEVHELWKSLDDYILHRIFDKEFTQDISTGKLCVPEGTASVNRGDIVFRANDYPYKNLQGQHFVLWYGCQTRPYNQQSSSKAISKDIENYLYIYLMKHDPINKSNFDFIWYENPKMSVPEFYHVHVFWTIVTDAEPLLPPPSTK